MTTPEANRPLPGGGWIEWTGGENPVGTKRVQVQTRGHGELAGYADGGTWGRWWEQRGEDTDIIAYRLARPTQPEPERDGSVERVRAEMEDAARYGSISASITIADLRHVLSLLSTAERQRDEAEANLRDVSGLRESIFSTLLNEAHVMVAPGDEPDAIRRLIGQRDEAVRALRDVMSAVEVIEAGDGLKTYRIKTSMPRALAHITHEEREGTIFFLLKGRV